MENLHLNSLNQYQDSGSDSNSSSSSDNEPVTGGYHTTVKPQLDRLLRCSDIPPLSISSSSSSPLQTKFSQWHQLRQHSQVNFNQTLLQNQHFRNPNSYRWLVDHLEINETGTNHPTSVTQQDFDPQQLAQQQEARAKTKGPPKFHSTGQQPSFDDAIKRARLIAQHLGKRSSHGLGP